MCQVWSPAALNESAEWEGVACCWCASSTFHLKKCGPKSKDLDLKEKLPSGQEKTDLPCVSQPPSGNEAGKLQHTNM